MSVRPSVRTEQLGSHWTDFYEIWCLGIFRKTVEKIQVPLKSDKNNGNFTQIRAYIGDNISFIFSLNKKCSEKTCRRNQNTHFISNDVSKIVVPFNRQYGEIRYSRTDHRWKYNRAHTLYMPITKTTNTHSEYVNNFRFSTATVVMRTHLNVTFYVHSKK
jgi:hypothetical protein